MFEASVSPDATIGCIDWLVYSQHSVWCPFDPTWTSDAGATVGQLAQKPCIFWTLDVPGLPAGFFWTACITVMRPLLMDGFFWTAVITVRGIAPQAAEW